MERTKRSIDMLSDFLCHILSLLPTKFSVRTSALAKRWRFMWAHVPHLQFYGSNFTAGSEEQQLDIISRVVMLHESKIIETFKLSKVELQLGLPSMYQLDTLIIYSIKRNVRNLYLDVGFTDENIDEIACNFPRLLLTCKTLVDLELVSCGLIPSSGELFLPSLKKLNLNHVEYEDDESLPHLLSGCPLLEELTVREFFREEQQNSGRVVVYSPTVKRLTVDFTDLGEDCPDEMLTIDVPALEYLKLVHCHLDSVKSLDKTMTSLIEAEITLNGCPHKCDVDCTEHARALEFLSSLCRVTSLKISSIFEEMLVDIVGTGSMPKFVNLTKLELGLLIDWYNVVKFLEVADDLQVLIINLYEMTPYTEPKRVPSCMLSRLRTVTMFSFGYCEDAFELVRYILRNARVLEWMEIYGIPYPKKEKLDALRKLLLLERGSTSCQVAFMNQNHAD